MGGVCGKGVPQESKEAASGGASRNKSFAMSNETWVNDIVTAHASAHAHLVDQFPMVKEAHERPTTLFMGFEEAEDDGGVEEMLRLGEETFQKHHDHELIGDCEEVCEAPEERLSGGAQHVEIPAEDCELIRACLSTHFLFSSFLSLDPFVGEMGTKTVEVGEKLFTAEHNHEFFVIKSGTFEAVHSDGEVVVYPDENGERGLGDMALMVDASSRSISVVTATAKGVVFSLSRLAFHRIAMEETKKRVKERMEILSHVKPLQDLSQAQILDVAHHLVSIRFEDGQWHAIIDG